jgi:spore germination cell wall hydrolase CwlJ-like protein
MLATAFVAVLATAGTAVAYTQYTDDPPVYETTVASSPEMTPMVKPMQIAPSPIELATAALLKERNCLAEAMYYEARGEGISGQKAIAEVIFQRMRTRGYPGTVCGVVYEGSNLRRSCQFSFTCSGEMNRTKTAQAWEQAEYLAAEIMTGAEPLSDLTKHATSFHAVHVSPGWSSTMVRTTQIGNHIFYRVASAHEM